MDTNKETEFSKHLKKLYSNSLVTGIPEIMGARNWKVRLIRLMIFICCIFGFIYQSLAFMELYWKYPTILDIQITRKGEVMMPGLTVCEPNGVYLSKYCANYPCKTPMSERRFCRCYPEGRYCMNRTMYPNIKIPMKIGDISRNTYFLPQRDRLHLMPKASDFILQCHLNRPPSTVHQICRDVTLTPTCSPTKVPEPAACFSINSIYGHPERKPPNISVSTAIELILFTPPEEYNPNMMIMFKQISLHSPYALSNPFVEGLFLHSEPTYKIFVKQTVRHLMKPPYDTNCYDYLQEWKKNGGTGPMSQNDCIQICKKNFEVSLVGNCLPYYIWYPSNEKRCLSDSGEICTDYQNASNPDCFRDKARGTADSRCESKCKPACWQVSYEFTKHEIPMDMQASRGPVIEEGFTYVTISFQKMEETSYTYRAKYDVIETFSYIGGYVGIWLGVSLLALFDFFETTVTLVKYPFQKKKTTGVIKTA